MASWVSVVVDRVAVPCGVVFSGSGLVQRPSNGGQTVGLEKDSSPGCGTRCKSQIGRLLYSSGKRPDCVPGILRGPVSVDPAVISEGPIVAPLRRLRRVRITRMIWPTARAT